MKKSVDILSYLRHGFYLNLVVNRLGIVQVTIQTTSDTENGAGVPCYKEKCV